MPFSRRRLILGVTTTIGLLVVALMLRLAFEWRQAMDDINAMIVTPVVLPSPNSASDTLADSREHPHATTLHQAQSTALAAEPETAALNITPLPTVASAISNEQALAQPERLTGNEVHILLLGTDARPEENGPTRTDAMVLVRLERSSSRVSMLSFPRDLWVRYPSLETSGRINAAYALGEKEFGPGGGAALAKATVGKLLGLKVDYFVLVNFQGFKTLIDRLGGITLDVPEDLYDPAYPTDDYRTIEVRFKAGKQHMDGERALIYARTRHADSDFGRNQRQQLVLMAIFDRVRDRGLMQQLTSIDDYTSALRDYVRTDIQRGVMIDLATWGRNLQPQDVRRYAIDSSMVVNLDKPATFAVRQRELSRVIGQFTGNAVSSAGGE